VIDIYKRRIPAERSFVDYAVFVSFFPLLVAGPIERATHLLPQIKRSRIFSYAQAVDGLRQILWGLFKKIVIADNCAIHANLIFDQHETLSAPALVLGALLFAFQIYGDFSGYSDIALGTARLFGIELLRNFAYPYFSRDIAEFWRRWHISLSTWFRDYLYIPLGGSKGGLGKKVRNTFIIFLVSGFWHGANWTFIVWGGLNALFFLPLLLSDRNRSNLDVVAHDRLLPDWKEVLQLISTFLLTSLAWIFFRAESVSHAAGYIKGFFIQPWSMPRFKGIEMLPALAVLLVIFFSIEWIGRRHDHPLKEWQTIRQRSVRWGLYILLVFLIGLFMPAEESPFIYFQF
jgi:D-alanyl-lipoteichoic acid acyltransferase DltB (MBOAT superfamily)